MLNPKPLKYRIFETIPGILIWSTFLLIVVLSIFLPSAVLYLITLFSLFWLFRVMYFVFYIYLAWRNYKNDIKADWNAELIKLKGHEELYHLIFLPTSTESVDVLRSTFQGLKNSTMDPKKMIVVLAFEERLIQNFKNNAPIIKKEFGDHFYKLLVTVHPDNVVGEMKGKGANANYAGKQSQKLIDELGIPYEKVIVSYFDCDTIVHPQYFSYLAYKYLTHPNPTRASYQPVVIYSNNIWDAPAINRVSAFSTTFWLLSELVRPDRLFTFSSHSMSFKALVDVDFWQKDIVTDDSRIFLQCFFKYNGDYSVTPLFIPVSMDAVHANSYFKSLKNLYKQQRRWAWGVEHFPYMIWNFFYMPNTIPLRIKFKYLFNFIEGMYSWASAPILLFIMGKMPFWFADESFKYSLLALKTPHVLQWLMSLSMAGIFTSIVLSLALLPPMPKHKKFYSKIMMVLQWALLPLTLIIFGSFPAIESQTRLMIGKYLGFWVTDKNRVNTKTIASTIQYEQGNG